MLSASLLLRSRSALIHICCTSQKPRYQQKDETKVKAMAAGIHLVGVAKTARLSLQVIYKDAMYHDRLTPLAEISLGVYYQDTQDIHRIRILYPNTSSCGPPKRKENQPVNSRHTIKQQSKTTESPAPKHEGMKVIETPRNK